MSKADLRKATGVPPNTITKMNKDEEVALADLGRICKELDCDYADNVSYVQDYE